MPFDPTEYTKGVWLKGEDLDEGERTVVTIKSAEEQTFQDGKKQPVLEFLELDQKLSLNKTRVKKLVELLGEDTEEWIGQKIALYPTPTQFNGKEFISVAVAKAPKGKQAKAEPEVTFERPAKKKQEEDDDDDPFN